MPPNLLTTWQRLKQQANASDGEVLERMARAYAAGYARIDPQLTALTEQIEALEKAGKLTSEQVKKSAAYKNLITAVTEELDDYESYLRAEVRAAVTQSAKQGMDAGYTLLLSAVAMALGIEVKDIPDGTILRPNDKTLEFLAKYFDPNGALFAKINGLSNYHATQIAEGFIERVSQGINPRVIARWFQDAYGVGLTDAMRICRTAQLYSYREASAATQSANSDVLQGSVWCAELDGFTCASCIALHGQVFEVGAVCDDHHNGRCALLPWVKGEPNPIEQTGESWFKEQDEAIQRSVMGDAKWEAWNEGKFDFSALSREYDDEVFGLMRGETPLKDLIGE
jgi:hypothetical protein